MIIVLSKPNGSKVGRTCRKGSTSTQSCTIVDLVKKKGKKIIKNKPKRKKKIYVHQFYDILQYAKEQTEYLESL